MRLLPLQAPAPSALVVVSGVWPVWRAGPAPCGAAVRAGLAPFAFPQQQGLASVGGGHGGVALEAARLPALPPLRPLRMPCIPLRSSKDMRELYFCVEP